MGSHSLRLLATLGISIGLAGLPGCEPMPDFRIVAYHVPEDTAALLVGAMLEGDRPAQTFRVVPMAGLDAAARERFVVGLAVGTSDAAGGSVSLATVRKDGCLSSVTSSAPRSRSDSFTAATIEIELDPRLNPAVYTLVATLDTAMACPKVPGLVLSRLGEPHELPIKPVIIRSNRLISVSDSTFEGALTAYGWGMGRGSLSVVIEQDPTNCRKKISDTILAPDPMSLARQLLAASVTAPQAMEYPNYSLVSYTQAELRWSKFSELLQPLGKDLINQLIQCFAITSQTYRKVNPDGAEAVFREPM